MKFTIEDQWEVVPELSQNPSIARSADGDLLLLEANSCDAMAGCFTRLRRSRDSGRTWSAPEFQIESELDMGGVESTISSSEGLTVIAYLEGSDLKRQPRNPKWCRMIRSTDGGRTWSPPSTLEEDRDGVMPFGKMIRLAGRKRLLLPTYSCEAWLDRGGSRTNGVILASDDDARSWFSLGVIEQDPSITGLRLTELSLLELPDGRLLSIARGDAVAPDAFPYGLRSVSDDGGQTWSLATPININVCEPRLTLTLDGRPLLVARSWPGNVYFHYRPLEPHEREPGSKQKETVAASLREEYLSPVRDFGVVLFTSDDGGESWHPALTLTNPRGEQLPADAEPLRRHRYQAAYPDMVWLDDHRLLVVIRQPDPNMPDLRPGLTYSHIYQRFVSANIVRCDNA